MSAQIKQMPPVHIGYAQARVILRHHRLHDLDAIDAAFEVLAYSPDPNDQALCRIVENEMWLVPTPSIGVIVITMVAVAFICVGVATLLGRLIL
jgi:hypothetical protein